MSIDHNHYNYTQIPPCVSAVGFVRLELLAKTRRSRSPPEHAPGPAAPGAPTRTRWRSALRPRPACLRVQVDLKPLKTEGIPYHAIQGITSDAASTIVEKMQTMPSAKTSASRFMKSGHLVALTVVILPPRLLITAAL